MFSCPNCAQVLGEYPDAGVLAVACARCTFRYELSGGTITFLNSRRVEVQAATERTRATYVRQINLVIATSAREALRFSIETDRDDDWIRIPTGNSCVVVFSMRGDEREEMLFVVDRTSGKRFVLAKPGQRSRALAIAGGSLAAIVAGVAAAASTLPFIAVAGIAVVVGVGTVKGLGYALKPKHALAAGERDSLTARQALLGRKRELLVSRGDVVAELERRKALQQRLDTLRAKMVSLHVDAYADRIAAIDRALHSLDEQLDIDRRLMVEYDRTIQMLEIEYESSVAADALPDDSASIMEARLSELKEVEELRAETTRRLAANAEVERLLRSHSD